jgi:hypothetical protein
LIAILSFTLFVVVTQIYIFRKSNFYKKNSRIPRYIPEDLEKELKNGDVLCTTNFESYLYGNLYFNYKMAHCSLVVEQDQIKYVIEHIPKHHIWNPTREVKSEKANFGEKWALRKTPLYEYLKLNPSLVIMVYRNPSPMNKISFPDATCEFKSLFIHEKKFLYCTMLIGRILSYNKHIQTSKKLFPYQTNDLLDDLKHAGYSSFLCIVN